MNTRILSRTLVLSWLCGLVLPTFVTAQADPVTVTEWDTLQILERYVLRPAAVVEDTLARQATNQDAIALPDVDKVQLELGRGDAQEKRKCAEEVLHSSTSPSGPLGSPSRSASALCLRSSVATGSIAKRALLFPASFSSETCSTSPSSVPVGSQAFGTLKVSPAATSSTAHSSSKRSKT